RQSCDRTATTARTSLPVTTRFGVTACAKTRCDEIRCGATRPGATRRGVTRPRGYRNRPRAGFGRGGVPGLSWACRHPEKRESDHTEPADHTDSARLERWFQ